jgi:hypothetical protein
LELRDWSGDSCIDNPTCIKKLKLKDGENIKYGAGSAKISLDIITAQSCTK